MSSKKIYIFCLTLVLFLLFPKVINAQVVINEFMPDASTEWVEFYNASSSADYIKAYYLDDDTDFVSDSGSGTKKLLTNLNMSNPTYPYFDTSSFLNNTGDYVVLFDSNGVIIDQYQYFANPGRDISVGRFPDGTGIFYTLSYSTKADSNPAPPTPTPIPTQISTSTPTTTPSKTPSPTPTPKPTPTKSPSPSPTQVPTSTPTEESTATETPTGTIAGAKTTGKNPIVSIILIFSGILFLGYGGYMLYNQKYGKGVNN